MLGKNKLYRVCLSYACFGVYVLDDKVIDAAPIGRWMIGKTLLSVSKWVKSKGGVIEQVEM